MDTLSDWRVIERTGKPGRCCRPFESKFLLCSIWPTSPERKSWDLALELPLGLHDEPRRPGSKIGIARGAADVPSTRSAIASVGVLLDMARWRWGISRSRSRRVSRTRRKGAVTITSREIPNVPKTRVQIAADSIDGAEQRHASANIRCAGFNDLIELFAFHG